jgi:response regulator RpfG family c-di-GMP phosphodiesterase/serine/threonine protein kinase
MSGPQRIGKYEIQSVIAKGRAATVCRGTDPAARRDVALKFVTRAAAQAEAITRIQQAAPALARLRHPAIATFYEVLEAGPAICLVSELIEGKSLAVLKDGAAPDLRRAWEIARQLLDALGAAHAKGVFHGDLRPANVFLDAQARIRLTDIGMWGLVVDASALPHYSAPEHLGLGEITARTDLYQAGVLVYELITGKLPFNGTLDEIVHRLMQERPADPSSHMGTTCWQLDWVAQRALSKDPNDRFATAAEFADALRKGIEEALGEDLSTAPTVAAALSAPAKPEVRAQPPKPAPAAVTAAPPKPAPAAMKAEPPKPAPAAVKAELPKPAAIRHEPPKATPAQPKPALVPQPSKTAPPAMPTKPILSSQAAAALVHKAKAAAQHSQASPPAASHGAGDRRVRVLFVDDEERILAGLRSLFRQEYNVFVTDNPEDALELVKRHDIQVIVSDQRMPQMTGVELLRQSKEQAPQVVRILLTGYSDLAALVGSINQGEIFRFVKKPWDNDELRQVLAEAARIVTELTDVQVPPPEAPRSAGSVLVIDPQQGLARGLQRLLAGRATVRLAASALEAVKLLDKEEIACIVADLDAGREHLVSLFKLLKKQRPEILSILVTDQPDSELVIDLINGAQIFRFVTKPLNARELRTHVGSALRRYATFKKIPSLVGHLASGLKEAISA